MKRTGVVVMTFLTLAVVATVGSPVVHARLSRLKGKILVTQKAPKKGADLVKFFSKNATNKLKAVQGANKWEFHFFAVLRKMPPADVINIVFYEYRGGRYRYVNAEDLKISNTGGGLIKVTGKYKLYGLLGYKKGRSYQMRLTVKNNRGNEVVFARSRRIFLK